MAHDAKIDQTLLSEQCHGEEKIAVWPCGTSEPCSSLDSKDWSSLLLLGNFHFTHDHTNTTAYTKS